MDFPITFQNQDELNKAVGDLRKEARTAAEEKFKGYVSKEDFDKAIAESKKAIEAYTATHSGDEKTIADLKASVKKYETDSVKNRIAHELGLPYGMASRLTGETEDEIKKDAENLKSLIGASLPKAPAASTEPAGSIDPKMASLKQVLDGLKTNK